MSGFEWTVVVLTCQHKDSEFAFQRELELRQQRGCLSAAAVVLVVRDRQVPVGSGGATLNALQAAAEHLSNRQGHTVVSADVLDDAHILILHTGRDFPWSSCSAAFCWLPAERRGEAAEAPRCCLDLLLEVLSNQICPGSPPGVWVCSTDMILSVPPDFVLSWEGFSGVRAVALPGDVSFAADHGVYLSDQQGRVRDIIYRGTREQIERALMHDGKVPLVSGPVFFSRCVSQSLLHLNPPLDGCTARGDDAGTPGVKLSLFLDLLRCLCSDQSLQSFVVEAPPADRSSRATLWRILRGQNLSLAYVAGGRYDYLTVSGEKHLHRLCCDWPNKNTLSHIQTESGVDEGARVINSVLDGDVAVATGAVVQHCHLQGPLKVPAGCLLSGLDLMTSQSLRQLELADDIIIQGHRIEVGGVKLNVFTAVGAQDDLQASCDEDGSSFLNQSWSFFYSRTGIHPEDLWFRGEQRCLLDARLFPVLHPRGGAAELGGSLLPCLRAAAQGGGGAALLETLDSIAAGSDVTGGAGLGVAARCLSCVADLLVCMAGGRGGLRSGPAANAAWSSAYFLLEDGDLRGGVRALAEQRAHWLSRPELLVRAARHYEGAAQVLLRRSMMSLQRFITIGRGEAPPLFEWQEVDCPARLDLAGGWSDTPPICFELGGSVTNAAVRVDGKRPIGARARRVPEPRLRLVGLTGGRGSGVAMETVCDSLDDLRDYNQPQAPGALLKAVCVFSGVVSLSSQNPLGHQLMERWGGGLEVHSWSELPTGSGLGTSSILAGALLAVVYRCTGRTYDTNSIIHAVLHLEQLLTTGGGWQDQVGGVVGGVKVCRSGPSLQVEVEPLRLSDHFLVSLQQRILLVYTGKTRLARNLLQDVVRNWHSRQPSIVHNAQQLVANSEECAKSCLEGSLSRLGQCLDRSWQQKKKMAPGCEPTSVRVMMEALRPLGLGQTMAGAGGGGFLCLLTREPHQQQAVLQVLHNTPGLGDFSVHSVEVDMDGMQVLPPS